MNILCPVYIVFVSICKYFGGIKILFLCRRQGFCDCEF